MDNLGDTSIAFDEQGHCNYCRSALVAKEQVYFPGIEGEKKLDALMSEIKAKGRGGPYDCIMGLSGGLDSSYLAYLGYTRFDLRILAVHVDDGFDAPVTQENLRKLSEACSIDLHMEKPDREQFFALTAAFIRAGVPNIAIPQDNLIFGYLHKRAKENKITHFLSGGNYALECILQRGNSHPAFDDVHIRDINQKYGMEPIDNLEITSIFKRKVEDRFRFGLKEARPLNYIDYRKDKAMAELGEFCGFDYYGGKHCESVFTKFLQLYYLPKKFNVDKRKSHLSSMIISDQMTRDEALEELKKTLYNDSEMEQDIQFVLDCLQMSRDEFDRIMSEKPRSHDDYKSSLWLIASRLNRKIRGF